MGSGAVYSSWTPELVSSGVQAWGPRGTYGLGAVSHRDGQTTRMSMVRWSVSVARTCRLVGSTTVKVAVASAFPASKPSPWMVTPVSCAAPSHTTGFGPEPNATGYGVSGGDCVTSTTTAPAPPVQVARTST